MFCSRSYNANAGYKLLPTTVWISWVCEYDEYDEYEYDDDDDAYDDDDDDDDDYDDYACVEEIKCVWAGLIAGFQQTSELPTIE